MEKYSLVIKNEKLRQYDRMALLILMINFLLLTYTGIWFDVLSLRIPAIAGAVLIAVCIGLHFYQDKTTEGKGLPFLATGLVICLLSWFVIRNSWGTSISLILFLLYHAATRPLYINFYEDRIMYSSFYKKIFSWQQLNNVMLKDGLLTIDRKDNHVLQAEIMNSEWDVNEKEFNEFCRRQLSETSPKQTVLKN